MVRVGSQRGELLEVTEINGIPVAPGRAPEGATRTSYGTSLADCRLARPALQVLDGLGTSLERWPWWGRADRTRRRLVSTTLATILLAALTAGQALHTHPRVSRLTHRVAEAAPASGIDALGCPVGRPCAVRRPADMARSVERLMPALRVITATETYDAVTGQVYRRELLARSSRQSAALRLVAQCVQHGLPITNDVHDFTTRTDSRTFTVGRRITRTYGRGCASFGYYTETFGLTSPGSRTSLAPARSNLLSRHLAQLSDAVTDQAVRLAP